MYCRNCGKPILNDSIYCSHCGARIAETPVLYTQQVRRSSTLSTVAYVFMVVATVLNAFFLIPLAWMIPMTVVYKRKIDHGLPVGLGFRICSLLFVSLIAGILMLCDDD